MSELCEILMILCFGASWPLNLAKSIKSRTAKGKSVLFLILVLLGYIAGITGKFLNESYMANFKDKWYVLVFYFINFFMVLADFILYFRNKKLDKEREAAEK